MCSTYNRVSQAACSTCLIRTAAGRVRTRGNASRPIGVMRSSRSRQVRARCRHSDFDDDARFPIQGALRQRRGGTVRTGAVVWGYCARPPIIGRRSISENCEVTGLRIRIGRVWGSILRAGSIRAKRWELAVAGSS